MSNTTNPETMLAAAEGVAECGGYERFQEMCTPDAVRSLCLRLRAASSTLRSMRVENDLMVSPLLRTHRTPRRSPSVDSE